MGLFCYWVAWDPYIFSILFPYLIYSARYFLPFCRFSLHFVVSFLAQAFYIDIIPLVYFSFVACPFGVISNISLSRPMSESFRCHIKNLCQDWHLMKETKQSSPASSSMWGHSKKLVVHEPRSRPDVRPAGNFIVEFPAFGPVRYTFTLFISYPVFSILF